MGEYCLYNDGVFLVQVNIIEAFVVINNDLAGGKLVEILATDHFTKAKLTELVAQ